MTAWLALPLGRLRVRLHLLLPVAAGALALLGGDLWLRYLLLLGVLTWHELGHAAAALALGRGAPVVSIWPWFGRADVETFPDRRQAWAALAGPAANLAAAGLLALLGAEPTLALGRAPLLDTFQSAHLLMGVGNLLPVRPADGGRALAALRRRG